MSLVTDRPLLPSLPDAIMQASTESEADSERNLSVSCLNCLLLAFSDNCQIQDSGSGLVVNAENVLITSGKFVVSLSCGLNKQSIIVTYLLC